MEKTVGYEEIKRPITIYLCDNCKGQVEHDDLIHWDAIWVDWGDRLGHDFDVCSPSCLVEFLNSNLPAYQSLYVPNDEEYIKISMNGKQMKKFIDFILNRPIDWDQDV